MIHYDISVDGLSLRSVQEKDLAALDCRAGDLQTFDYISNRNPAVRRYGARAATASSVAYALLEGSHLLNEYSLKVWLKHWLRNNANAIREKLTEENHDVFVVLVNYTKAQTQNSTIFSGHSAHLIDTVRDLGAIGDVLTYQRLYGPRAYPTPRNNLHSFHSTYLIGTRAGTGSRLFPDPLRSLQSRTDTSFLSRYGL